MISKIQSAGYKPSFKNSSENTNIELTEYKKNFLTELAEKEYQQDLKKYKKVNLWSSIIWGTGAGGYYLYKGDTSGALISVVIAVITYPLMNIFKPKKEKYDKKIQEELNKLA